MKDGTAWEKSRAVPSFMSAIPKILNYFAICFFDCSKKKFKYQMRRTKKVSQKQKISFWDGSRGGRVKRFERYTFQSAPFSGQFRCSVSFENLVDRSGYNESRICTH